MKSRNPKLKAEARKLYLAGEPVIAIAKKTGASERAIYTWAERDRWNAEREEVEREAAERSKASLISEREKIQRIYFGLWNRLLTKASEVLAKVDLIPEVKDRAAALCTLGLTMLRGHKGHAIAGGWQEEEPKPLHDDVQDLTDAELKQEIADLHREINTDAEAPSGNDPPAEEDRAQAQSA